MEVRDIEARNLTDEIVDSMSETGSQTYADYQLRFGEFRAPYWFLLRIFSIHIRLLI